MKNMTIGKRIILGFSATLLVVLGLGGFAYQRLVEIKGHSTKITVDCLPGLAVIGDILNKAQENYMFILRGALTTNAQERATLAALMQTNVAQINQLTNDYNATITMAKDRDLFAELIAARSHFVATLKGVTTLANEGKSTEVLDLIRGTLQPEFDKFESAIEALVDFNKENGHESGQAIGAAVSTSIRGIIIGVASSVLLGVGIAFWIIRSINRILRRTSSALADGADQVAAASSQVAAASQSLAEGASEQAASLEETSASLEEMTSMVKRNAQAAQKAKAIAGETRSASDAGASDVQELQTAMREIKTSSDDVAKIVKSIDEIAFQTNILALNAAVEAARAGEAGAGFAVVADEVRNLAQRSAMAAKETASKIEAAIARSQQGVVVSERVAAGLQQIAGKIREVDQLVAEISTASDEQAQGISQVNIAVTQMDKVTQSNAAGAEESASAASELNAQAESVKESLKDLQKLVGVGSGSPAASPSQPVGAPWKQAAPPRTVPATLFGAVAAAPAARRPGANSRMDDALRKEAAIPMSTEFKDF
jgi:methyl-accepting chemotaxis protein